MELKTIKENLAARHGIRTLNDMQMRMSADHARSIILLAPTGSGKTVAFAIRLLRALGNPHGEIQAVVLAPSRELVIQIADVLRPVAAGLKTVAFYGGHPMVDEENSLKVTPDIIVATPGRLLDHIRRGNLSVAAVKALVIDEYDKMLELGFLDEMKRIVTRMKTLDMVILTSATRLSDIPDFLPIKGAETLDYSGNGPAGALQIVRVTSPSKDKLDTLDALLRALPNGRALVFVNHRDAAERVFSYLKDNGFPVGLYHGGLDQRERQLAVDLLNNGTTPVLVTTDLGARGLDIDSVDYVIHYHTPLSAENWTHRNGRTARMGATGTVYVILSDDENIPEYVTYDREYFPKSEAADGIRSDVATLYINAGKKEKISRGDVAGYLMKAGGLRPDEVGKIVVADHYAIAAIPRAKAGKVLTLLAPAKLKNTRVRTSLLNGH
ncbi:MAG: DEAD/DEAH box helicase [Muribaculaceae bacterium]|nr:DEAD/DEAH box helicase [Muribaculaceae bacterium]